jgi:DNA-binding PadR family transcriptional regulator
MRTLRVPDATHLQFLVLSVLRGGEQPGRVVRQALAEHGARRTAAAFYQLMARLEQDRLVVGAYAPVIVGDQTVTERRYRITPAGLDVWEHARAFYLSVGAAARARRWSDA